MYSNEVSAPVAVVGTLAMTGPDSMIVWVVVGAVALGGGAFLTWRRRLLRHAAPAPRGRHDRCR
ncbi:LPXTG cell wall anchor domain-containing protein [Microbacterium sp. NPDC058269]|jgi:LPXTG-motif cell wall-anchored protein|uniref:LPXTG cell wall anchor domain-containing protein n=1 Tax=Microbacterium sp. NPDC058269 TaxID=3346414 RepID=UPI0036DBCB09